MYVLDSSSLAHTRTHLNILTAPTHYQYTGALAACTKPSPPPLPLWLQEMVTPLNLRTWEFWLSFHPDEAFSSYLLEGIAHGFRIGYAHHTHSCTPATCNHPSGDEHPSVISAALAKELEAGRLKGPLPRPDFPYVHVSSLGAIAKKHAVNKWRIILDLSHPAGASVNDGIDSRFCSLTYMKVADVVT